MQFSAILRDMTRAISRDDSTRMRRTGDVGACFPLHKRLKLKGVQSFSLEIRISAHSSVPPRSLAFPSPPLLLKNFFLKRNVVLKALGKQNFLVNPFRQHRAVPLKLYGAVSQL